MDERELSQGSGEAPPPVPPSSVFPVEKKTSRKKLVLWMSAALVALLLIAGLIGGLYAWRFVKAANALTIEDVDISKVPDGAYRGAYEVFHVKAAVEVEVEGGRIVSIALLDSGRMSEDTQREIRDIFDEVISSQSLDVDITSGASASKKVSLKAVEEALGGGE